MKTCKACGVEKDASDFNKHTGRKDGLQSECKKCRADKYVANKEHIRALQREYWKAYSVQNSDERREKSRLRRTTSREAEKLYRDDYKVKFAPKIAAKSAIWSGILTGKIAQKPCEVCNSPKADAHHDDYAKPLDIRWLCRRHHSMWHSENGEAPNGRAIEQAVWEKLGVSDD